MKWSLAQWPTVHKPHNSHLQLTLPLLTDQTCPVENCSFQSPPRRNVEAEEARKRDTTGHFFAASPVSAAISPANEPRSERMSANVHIGKSGHASTPSEDAVKSSRSEFRSRSMRRVATSDPSRHHPRGRYRRRGSFPHRPSPHRRRRLSGSNGTTATKTFRGGIAGPSSRL